MKPSILALYNRHFLHHETIDFFKRNLAACSKVPLAMMISDLHYYYTYHTERAENAIADIDRMLAKG
jgi:hypothetical protein